MAEKRKKDEVRESTAMVIAESEDMSVAEMAHALTVAGMGEGWEVVVSGSVPYWNPGEAGGEVCAGTLLRRQEIVANVKGQLMDAALYMIKLAEPCRVNAISPDGEAIVAEPGDVVSVIERKILTGLSAFVGKEIAIFCDGKGKSKRGLDLWKYRVAVRKTAAASPSL